MLKNQVAWESASIVADTMEKIVDNCKTEKRQETRELLLSIVEEMSSEANRIVKQLSKMSPEHKKSNDYLIKKYSKLLLDLAGDK